MKHGFHKYRRKNIAECRPITNYDVEHFLEKEKALYVLVWDKPIPVSVSLEDMKNGSPQIGDVIARNPDNHYDQWLIAEKYFKDNFEEVE